MIVIVMVLLVASIMLNSYMMRREALRREHEHERRQERFERLITMLQKQNSDKEAQVSDTTKGEEYYKS